MNRITPSKFEITDQDAYTLLCKVTGRSRLEYRHLAEMTSEIAYRKMISLPWRYHNADPNKCIDFLMKQLEDVRCLATFAIFPFQAGDAKHMSVRTAPRHPQGIPRQMPVAPFVHCVQGAKFTLA
jgi:hypothetical protein